MKKSNYFWVAVFVFASFAPTLVRGDSYDGPYCDDGSTPSYPGAFWEIRSPDENDSRCRLSKRISRFYLDNSLAREFVLVENRTSCRRDSCGPAMFSVYEEGSEIDPQNLEIIPVTVAKAFFRSSSDLIATKDESYLEYGEDDPHPQLLPSTLYEYYDELNGGYYLGEVTNTTKPLGSIDEFRNAVVSLTLPSELKRKDEIVPAANPVEHTDTIYTITRNQKGELVAVKTRETTFFTDGTRKTESVRGQSSWWRDFLNTLFFRS